MCELFAMSSREPATVSISLDEFARHGGLTGPHKDGWGVAFYDGPDVRVVREPGPAFESGSVQFIKDQSYRSTLVISHIRQATSGEVTLRNTQPFSRELKGRMHVFAHNGDLEGVREQDPTCFGHFRPIGNADSEYAFLMLMGAMEALWANGGSPSLEARLEQVAEFAADLRPRGPANFIYSDSEFLFAHGHERTQPEDNVIGPPGLYTLCRTCEAKRPRGEQIDGLDFSFSAKQQEVILVASVPLTSERWSPVGEGEVLALAAGHILARHSPVVGIARSAVTAG